MVTTLRNGHSDQSSEFKSWMKLFAFPTDPLGKGMNPTILSPARGNK